MYQIKQIFLCLVIPQLLLLSSTSAQIPEEVLKQHSIEWMKALERKDTAALEYILAAEYTLGGVGDGEKVTRATWLKNAYEMDWSNTDYKFLEVHMKSDSAALVNSSLKFKVSWFPFPVTSNIIDYWVYRDGRWQVVHRMIGGDSITNLLNGAKGFFIGIALMMLILFMRRMIRRKKRSI